MRTVNLRVLNEWIEANGPDGVTKLAFHSGVSASLLHKTRAGRVPVRESKRLRICKEMGLAEDTVFPLVESPGRGSADGESG